MAGGCEKVWLTWCTFISIIMWTDMTSWSVTTRPEGREGQRFVGHDMTHYVSNGAPSLALPHYPHGRTPRWLIPSRQDQENQHWLWQRVCGYQPFEGPYHFHHHGYSWQPPTRRHKLQESSTVYFSPAHKVDWVEIGARRGRAGSSGTHPVEPKIVV